MRTTNMLERQNRELKRRTRVATLFPNEASLLRLATAVLAEISDEWETGPMSYLTFKNQQQKGIPILGEFTEKGLHYPRR
jgi:transposase-like protein